MIEILFYRGISTVSKLIRWQTRSPVSHVALMRTSPDDVRKVVEAWHKPFPRGGVHVSEGQNAIFNLHTTGTEVEIYECPSLTCDHELAGRVWQHAMKYEGMPYDFRMVWRFLPRGKETKGSRGKLFCSELVAKAFRESGCALLDRVPDAHVSPGMLRTSPLLKYRCSVRNAPNGSEWISIEDSLRNGQD